MSKMINKLLLAGDMLMYEMHLRQPIFRNSACAQFTENKERIQKVKQIGDLIYNYQNELYKACFQHDMAYGYFKDLPRRTDSGKVFDIAENPK